MSGRLIDAARTFRSPAQVDDSISSYRSRYRDPATPPRGEAQIDNVVAFYDLVTDFYEYGWGQCFHFAVLRNGDTLKRAIDRHEYWLATATGLGRGSRALDLGCGVGGPMRYLARATGAHITGVNLNDTQIARAKSRARAEGLVDRIAVEKADFAALPFDDGTFDVVYAIEATCHASDRKRVFAEAFRVLKPGGKFAGYEWCTTDKFDPNDAEHVRIARGIEEGNALPPLTHTGKVDEAVRAAGFVLHETRDVADDCDPETPWWASLNGHGGLRALPRTPVGRSITGLLVRGLEALRIAPRGATKVSALLNSAADALVEGGRTGIFTPMYRWSASKPS
jgi:sterol 24-C-methyltransferase